MRIQCRAKRIETAIRSSIVVFLTTVFMLLYDMDLHAAAYFQQFLKYEIGVELIPELGRLEGKQQLTYFNNSPDTLSVLYFHLYLNKFRSGSYAFPFSRKTSAYIDILSLKSESGKELDYNIANTILKLPLEEQSIPPNDSLKLLFEFISVLPQSKDRFGYTGDHFDVGNWYPVPAVYDHFGWHTDQHIDGEFYQEWADYEVNITVPKDFVVGATGVLRNPEVMPDSVAFANRKIDYYDLQTIDTTTVTYEFLAEEVHDFAWTADPEFVLVKREAAGAELRFLLMPYRLDEWKSIIDECVKGFEFLIDQIGQYPYEQLTIVDGYITAGGIEYPNIVFINDYIIDLRQLAITVIHEMAHQWFYGLIANNQTRYGWMDEGFTTFYEVECTEHIWGKKGNFFERNNSFWSNLFGYKINARHHTYLNYFQYELSGLAEPVNTHSDAFQNDPYTPYYDKTAIILFTLKEMIGDSLFAVAVQNFFKQWKFRHPYPEDLFRSFEQTINMQLDWFWEQWLDRTWKCDYRLKEIKTRWKNDFDSSYYSAYLQLQRVQPMAMPVNLRLTLSNGQVLNYRIPVAGWLNDSLDRKDSETQTDLEPWHLTNTNYLVHLKLPAKINKAEIDPKHDLPDINTFNNDNRFLPPLKFHWFSRQYLEPHLNAYTTTLYPAIFYNTPDGIKIGIRSRGNYIYPLYQSSSEILFSTKKGYPSVDLTWRSPLSIDLINYDYRINGYYSDGRVGGKTSILKTTDENFQWEIGWEFQRLTDREYLITPWSSGNISNIFLILEKNKEYRNSIYSWNFLVEGRSSTLGSDFDFQQVELHWTNEFELAYDKRLVAELASGFSFGNIPDQNYFYLAQASPIKQFEHPYIRAKGTLPTGLFREGHFMVPGGGNIRSSLETPVSVKTVGENFVSGSLRLHLPNPLQISPVELPIISDLEWNLFTNWGQVWDSKIREDQFAGETGLTISYNYLPIWLRYFHLSKIHLDFPLWLNKTAPGYNQWDYRWTLRLDIQKIFN